MFLSFLLLVRFFGGFSAEVLPSALAQAIARTSPTPQVETEE